MFVVTGSRLFRGFEIIPISWFGVKMALAGISLVAVGLIVLNIKTYQTFENFKPLVIRISDSQPRHRA